VPDLRAPRAEHIRHHDRLASLTEQAGILNQDLNAILEGRSAEVRSELRKVLELTQAATLTMLSLSILVAVVTGIVLVRFIAHPVADLQLAVKTISAGDLNARVSGEGPRELLDLARGFNNMVSALEESRALVAQQERRAAIGELAAGVAHELNNPLGVIRGYLKVLREGIHDPQSDKDLDIIADEVNQCQRIVQGLLELARPRPLELEQVELVATLREALERLDKARGSKSAKMTFSSMPSAIQATVDVQAIKRVLINLVNNAVDAAGPDGEVDVRIEEIDGSTTISVSDTGEGIPPELKDDLFKPFHTTKRHGTGLGLAICDTLVRAHGGHIDVGDGPKGGALFRVVIPRIRNRGAGT
jgi:two-component system NtrC family sensor kinase